MGTQKLIVVGTTNAERTHKIIDTTGLADADLSWKAKGMHAYIRTHGDGWLKNQEALVGASTDGRDAVRAGIAELVERKYLHRTTVRNDIGQISYHLYISVPMPMEFSDEQIIAIARGEEAPAPQPGLPAPGNPLQVRLYSNYTNPSGKYNYVTSKPYNPSGYKVVESGGTPNPTISELIAYWNNQPNLPTLKTSLPHTKAYNQSAKALQKELPKQSAGLMAERIKGAIDNYNHLLGAKYTRIKTHSNQTKLSAPYRVQLYEFFGFTPFSIEQMNKMRGKGRPHILHGITSWYSVCTKKYKDLEAAFALISKDQYPNVTKQIIAMWEGLADYEGTPQELNNIHESAIRIKQFVDQNKKRFYDFRSAKTLTVIKRLGESLEGKEGLHTGWLVSDIALLEMERYLVDQNVMKAKAKPVRRANG